MNFWTIFGIIIVAVIILGLIFSLFSALFSLLPIIIIIGIIAWLIYHFTGGKDRQKQRSYDWSFARSRDHKQDFKNGHSQRKRARDVKTKDVDK